jgi:hypothetical protein
MWSLPRTAILFFGAWANSNPEMLSDLRFPEGSSCTALGSPILSAPTRPGFGILSDQSLTLVTCYPFYFVGPAPKRFVIRARRIDTE